MVFWPVAAMAGAARAVTRRVTRIRLVMMRKRFFVIISFLVMVISGRYCPRRGQLAALAGVVPSPATDMSEGQMSSWETP